jgi:preprotein translocase subunit YajC
MADLRILLALAGPGREGGDKILLNSGIFGTITGVEEEAFQIRIDDKTRIKVLKSAVAGLQPEPGRPTEK